MSISSIGNVAIGTGSATAKLHLPAGTGAARTAPLKLTSGTNLAAIEDGAMEYDGTNLYYSIGATRYKVSLTTSSSTETFLETDGGNAMTGNFNTGDGDMVSSVADGAGAFGFKFNTGVLNNATALAYDFQENGTTRLSIDENGNVGIGTTGQSARLEVVDTTDTRIRVSGGGSPGYEFNDVNTRLTIPAANTIAFTTSNLERARIDNNGRLGIGTNSPQALLHIGNAGSSKIYLEDSTAAANRKVMFLESIGGSFNFGKYTDDYLTQSIYFKINQAGQAAFGATAQGTGVGKLTLGDTTNRAGLYLMDDTSDFYALIQPSAATTANYTLTLPVDDGTAGQVLTSDGSGVLSWSSVPVISGGAGSANKVAFWDTASGLSYNANFHWDNTNTRLGIGTTTTNARVNFPAGTTAADGIDFGGDVNLFRSGVNALKTDDTFYAGYLWIAPQGNPDEGGELTLQGGDNGAGADWGNIAFDNYQGNARIHTLAAGKYLEIVGGSGLSVGGTNFFIGGDSLIYELSTNNIRVSHGVDLSGGTAANTTAAIEVGQASSGNRYAFIDLRGDDTYTDYGLRVIRNNTGANTDSTISHRGTGKLELIAVDNSGKIQLTTPATGGQVTISSPYTNVTGQLAVGVQTPAGGTNTIDLNSGNVVKYSGEPTAAVQLDNIKSGATYIIVIPMDGTPINTDFTNGTGSACSGGFKWVPARATAVASKDSLYTIAAAGTVCYVTWTSGY
ncbi:MAG: hypothetical protein IT289_06830 [Oligoflexia bacterium]|nr:hypothetical protein [Oligoflexia bacterium]